jgi:hypothetical protein
MLAGFSGQYAFPARTKSMHFIADFQMHFGNWVSNLKSLTVVQRNAVENGCSKRNYNQGGDFLRVVDD